MTYDEETDTVQHDIELLTTDDLLKLPPQKWLLEGLIPEQGIAGLYGPSGEAKSFIALDWANHISEGMDWHGRKVNQSPVVYIAGEGQAGIQKRQRGWMQAHPGHDLRGMYYLLRPLYVREKGVVEDFIEELTSRDIWPGLVVIDTLSRSFGAGDEVNSADMGGFVARV